MHLITATEVIKSVAGISRLKFPVHHTLSLTVQLFLRARITGEVE